MGLIEKAMQHDAEAFVELMKANNDIMYKTAYSILRNNDDVADAMQDTILLSYEKIDTLKKARYFRTWLMRILINSCYGILRARKEESYGEELPEIPENDTYPSDSSFEQLIHLADEKYRLLLTLYYADELSTDEISSLLHMNKSTVRTQLSRARTQIRRCLDETEYIIFSENGGRHRYQENDAGRGSGTAKCTRS